MSVEIPVVFIHKGKSDYLPIVIEQAEKRNKVYLISDDNIHQYQDKAEQFKKLYTHMSTLPEQFELFCFQRWFILREWMKTNNFETVMYCDSDVLLFCDVTEEYKNWNQYEMTLLHRTALISSYITFEGLDLFCEFLLKTYSDKNKFEFRELVNKWNLMQEFKMNGGVCDMTLLNRWHYLRTPARIGEMMQVVNWTTFDHCINSDDGYEMKDSHKNYAFGFGYEKPYIWHNKLEQMVQFNSLHCQGGVGKKMIPKIFNLCN